MTDITDCYFTSLTAPTAFFAIRLGTDAWDNATSADQTKALQMATYRIDSLDYQGYKLLSTQARQFPRKYVPTDSLNPWGNLMSEDPYGYIYDSSDIPQFVLDACCLEALALLEYHASTDPISEQDLIDKGVSSFSLGKLSMSFKGKSNAAAFGLRSQEAYDLLSPYLQRRGDFR